VFRIYAEAEDQARVDKLIDRAVEAFVG